MQATIERGTPLVWHVSIGEELMNSQSWKQMYLSKKLNALMHNSALSEFKSWLILACIDFAALSCSKFLLQIGQE